MSSTQTPQKLTAKEQQLDESNRRKSPFLNKDEILQLSEDGIDQRFTIKVNLESDIEIRSIICGLQKTNLKKIVEDIDPNGDCKIFIEFPPACKVNEPVIVYSVDKQILAEVAERLYYEEYLLLKKTHSKVKLDKKYGNNMLLSIHDILFTHGIGSDLRFTRNFKISRRSGITKADFNKGERFDKSEIINQVRKMLARNFHLNEKVIIEIEESYPIGLIVTMYTKIKWVLDYVEKIIRKFVWSVYNTRDSIYSSELFKTEQEAYREKECYEFERSNQLNEQIHSLRRCAARHRKIKEELFTSLRSELVPYVFPLVQEWLQKMLEDPLLKMIYRHPSWGNIIVSLQMCYAPGLTSYRKQIRLRYCLIENTEYKFVKLLKYNDLNSMCCVSYRPSQEKQESDMDEITQNIENEVFEKTQLSEEVVNAYNQEEIALQYPIKLKEDSEEDIKKKVRFAEDEFIHLE